MISWWWLVLAFVGGVAFGFFLALIITNLILTVGESLSYALEFVSSSAVKGMMILGNTLFYIALVAFPYLLSLYTDYEVTPGMERMRKRKLLLGIPCFMMIAVMIINLKSGWIFSIGEGNVFQSGKYDELLFLPVIPVWFYLAFSLIKMYRIDRRLLIVTIVLILARLAAEVLFSGISSTSFFYTLILVSLHLFEMNRPLYEEVLQ